jgi:hypothetical protein
MIKSYICILCPEKGFYSHSCDNSVSFSFNDNNKDFNPKLVKTYKEDELFHLEKYELNRIREANNAPKAEIVRVKVTIMFEKV